MHTTQTAMVGSCPPYGGWSHSKIHHGELESGRTTKRPHLRYTYVCVIYMKAVDIDTMSWESLAADRTKRHLKTEEDKPMTAQLTSTHKGGQQLHPTRNEAHYALSASKTATPTLVYSAITDAATTHQEINKI